ncbi:thiamine phosphate synthase [Nocardioides daeguensis]|uniref:Thiamine-phosphate synthase n=1 Tax=Nocardioides daeguensis TaxID=908359 RepID=A0ABP6W6G8_9ACTN|nr:thiamine phosphate synthase [Nocardioides daeguensis]MBV6727595.1 thiamine phosphate synthase [Nocardioides daeguensis]MCR1771456.1 thiamine phosphate synthase [Nocardioides daeguensis]
MTPRLFCLVSERDDLSLLPALADAGVDGFQVRAKSLATGALVALARRVVAAVRPAGALVVVNDRLDVALAAGADGVHLGADDLAVADARRLAAGLLVGATCRSRAEVLAAASHGADYAGFGPVFASGSKAGLPAPVGVAAVTEAAGVLPLVAIGGICAETAGDVRMAGAHGVAVIGAIWRHPDPLVAAKELVAAVA